MDWRFCWESTCLQVKKQIISGYFFKINISIVHRLSDSSHIFSYIMDPAIKSPVITLLYMPNIQRVAVGLLNGRLFLVDATKIPTNYACAEGSFVLTELCSGQILYSACVIPSEG